MTPSQQTLASLEASLQQLLQQYASLQVQVGILQEANKNQRDELIRSHAELAELREKYRQLQTAHALVADSPERDKARKQITSIINKVDKIAGLLTEEYDLSRTSL